MIKTEKLSKQVFNNINGEYVEQVGERFKNAILNCLRLQKQAGTNRRSYFHSIPSSRRGKCGLYRSDSRSYYADYIIGKWNSLH